MSSKILLTPISPNANFSSLQGRQIIFGYETLASLRALFSEQGPLLVEVQLLYSAHGKCLTLDLFLSGSETSAIAGE